jgi:hypothetical protein
MQQRSRQNYVPVLFAQQRINPHFVGNKNRNTYIISHSQYGESADKYQICYKLIWDSHHHIMTLGEQKRKSDTGARTAEFEN